MEQYELAEKQVLTELPTKYPMMFEVFIIVKLFLTTIFDAIFNLEITDDSVYYGIIWIWIVEFAVCLIVMIVTFCNVDRGYSMSTAYTITAIAQVVTFIIHTAIGHTRNYRTPPNN